MGMKHRLSKGLTICFVVSAMSAMAQVTGSGTSGTIPVFTGASTVGNSPISVPNVLVITTDGRGDVQRSSEPYSTSVAGIYAAKPGVAGRRQTLANDSPDLPMAMIGIVPTMVSAENGAIHRGDLLVTASIPGYAMKGTDRSRMLGAVIGKSMGSLDSGTGMIEVLVTLQ